VLELTESARMTAGIVALTIVAVESGGVLLLRMATGGVPATKLQGQFFRAGHAHAGVLITLGLVCLLLTQATALTGGFRWLAQTGVLVAAVLMPAGFFFSAAGPGRERPNRAIVLIPAGAVVLAGGVVTLGVGLLTS
jgi:hypothetical protein